jgi:hypothetical protein
LIGDEYGYLDLFTGDYWHAAYPIGLKAGAEIPPCISTLEGIPKKTSFGLSSTLFSLGSVRLACSCGVGFSDGGKPIVSQGKKHILQAMVFPQWREELDGTRITRASVSELPTLLMPSVEGVGQRANLFSRFLYLLSHHKIELLSVEYSDAGIASEKITEYLNRPPRRRTAREPLTTPSPRATRGVQR